MVEQPSANGTNGRDESGRFVEGNLGGPGNPHAKQVARVRSAMLNAVSVDDLRAICAKLVELAKAGSIPAAKEVFDRCLGRNQSLADLTHWMDRIERDAGSAAEEAERVASNRPEALAQRISDGSGISPVAILRFVTQKPEDDQTDLAVRLARATGVEYDALADFLNGQLDELRRAYDAQQALETNDEDPH